ncbi:MAG: ROK family protein [Microbacterium sp.]|nr:MAG: ROK family protein [Microbacterium sp.]
MARGETRAADGGESLTVTGLRQRNRAVALQFIIRERETTRADVARHGGLSSASAANIVGDLLADDLVVETRTVASRGGRPIAMLGPSLDGAYAIGVDVGERGVAVELFDLGLNMIDREFRGGAHEESFEAIEADLRDAVAAVRARNGERWERVRGIGLGLPGVVEANADGSHTLYAQSLGWEPRSIPGELDGLPVFAENGATTLARAELWFGGARGVDHALVALLGRGVGLGVVTDGELYRGAFSSATEWGHTKVRFGGEVCRCGARGCVEAYVGAHALLTAWERVGGVFEGTGWTAIGQLLDAAEHDVAAAGVLDTALEALGAGLGSLVNLTNPQRIVLGGWVGLRLMERHPDRILDVIRRNSLQRAASQFELVPATFGGDTVALGSALMPIEALIHGAVAR